MTAADHSAASGALRVLVVDDHALFRGGLASLLREHGLEVVGEAATGEDGVRLAGVRAPDAVIMDLGLPGISGVEATRRIVAEHPGIAVLVVTASLDESDVIDALVAGATGYLLKDAPIEQIVAGINAGVDGEPVISPRVNRRLIERLREQRHAQPDTEPMALSEREREILGHVVAGRDNAEIARELYLSQSTVKNHVSAILLKLGVENRVQAAVQAVRAGLA